MRDRTDHPEEAAGSRRPVSPPAPGNHKIKLLYVIDSLSIGGTEKQLVELINRLNPDKYDLSLCCLRDSEYLQKLELDCNVLVLDLRSLVSIAGLRKLAQLSKYIRSGNIQIVQTFFIDANIVGTIAARLGGAQAVISSRREMVYWYTPMILLAFKMLKYFTTRYLANSSNVRDYVSAREGIPKDRIDVLYNGIDLMRYRVADGDTQSGIRDELGVAPGDAIVGIVSNLNRPVKRVDVFLLAAAEILGKGIEAIFVIVGEGHLKAQLQHLGKELGIANRLRFVGSKENVIPYIQSFNIAVNSSESEGFSNAVLEYMACGVPAVATSFGGSSEAIIHGETGLLVEPNNHLEMAEAIIGLINDPVMARTMGKRGRERVENKFAFEVVVRRQEQYYSDILSRDRVSGNFRRST